MAIPSPSVKASAVESFPRPPDVSEDGHEVYQRVLADYRKPGDAGRETLFGFGDGDVSSHDGDPDSEAYRMKKHASLRCFTVLCLLGSGCGGPSSPVRLPPPPSPHLVATVSVGIYPLAAAVDPTTHTVYVVNTLPVGAPGYGVPGTVSVIDGATNTVTSTLNVGVFPSAVAVDPTTHTVYVASLDGVSVIDGTHSTVIADVPIGGFPAGVAVDAGTQTVYVLNGNNTVSVIDERTNTVTATVTIGYGPFAFGGGVAVDPTTRTVYAASENTEGSVAPENASTVTVIDGNTDEVMTKIAVGGNPSGVAVDPSSHTVYVANGLDNTLSVIDENTHTVTATLAAGHLPLGVAVDPTTHTVYLPSNGDRTVLVIDGRTSTLTTAVPGDAPDGIGIDSTTHTVYVTNNGVEGTVSVIAGVQ
jgi:YVTN family beta-propeller protein